MNLILVDRAAQFATVTMNRPEARNALGRALVADFRATLADLAADPTVRALIVAGTRESNAFCAGADLVERTTMSPEERLDHLAGIAALCEELAAFPSPVIAAVHGYALGGGTEVALACDIRIAADTAIFGLPEVSVGLIPGAGGVTRLPKLVGAGRARELMFSARRIDAVEAERIGLVELVVPLDTLETSARDLAGTIATHAPLAMRALKRALRSSEGLPVAKATEAVLAERRPLDQTRDYLEGMTAFKEKRRPVYTGE
ncbi:MAG TPA: enoyl-CoA hydratase-related protein [Thermomicrobiales bacterium]|nr:enoyl-CoA hydratase-related protein [Thermomicrobiales bacterium]